MPEETAPAAMEERGTEGLPSAEFSPRSTDPDETDAPPQSRDARLLHKCPYLAGRPPYGTHHLWPSGANVCYARPSDTEPYGHVSKEMQDGSCLAAAEVHERCPDFGKARARALAPPSFSAAAPRRAAPVEDEETPAGRRRKVKRRRHRSPFRRWLEKNGRSTLISACWLLLAAVSFWLVVHRLN